MYACSRSVTRVRQSRARAHFAAGCSRLPGSCGRRQSGWPSIAGVMTPTRSVRGRGCDRSTRISGSLIACALGTVTCGVSRKITNTPAGDWTAPAAPRAASRGRRAPPGRPDDDVLEGLNRLRHVVFENLKISSSAGRALPCRPLSGRHQHEDGRRHENRGGGCAGFCGGGSCVGGGRCADCAAASAVRRRRGRPTTKLTATKRRQMFRTRHRFWRQAGAPVCGCRVYSESRRSRNQQLVEVGPAAVLPDAAADRRRMVENPSRNACSA